MRDIPAMKKSDHAKNQALESPIRDILKPLAPPDLKTSTRGMGIHCR
jgi:hypothetical protein